MITYSSISNRDDKLFHRVAKKVIGNDYGYACGLASDAFTETYRDSPKISRVNDARKAANLIIVGFLHEFGVYSWRELFDKKTRRVVVKSGFVSEESKKRVFKSSDGLWEKKI